MDLLNPNPGWGGVGWGVVLLFLPIKKLKLQEKILKITLCKLRYQIICQIKARKYKLKTCHNFNINKISSNFIIYSKLLICRVKKF